MSALPIPAANLAEMAERFGLRTVTAAWPTGLARLGTIVSTCEACDASLLCENWLARAPKRLSHMPPFCPNGDALRAAAERKSRG